jgi:hypothetical protein
VSARDCDLPRKFSTLDFASFCTDKRTPETAPYEDDRSADEHTWMATCRHSSSRSPAAPRDTCGRREPPRYACVRCKRGRPSAIERPATAPCQHQQGTETHRPICERLVTDDKSGGPGSVW